jgi:hypothetical protein
MFPIMLAPDKCPHAAATLAFERSGTRLHPKVFMIERCTDCAKELDRKRFSSTYETSRRPDK